MTRADRRLIREALASAQGSVGLLSTMVGVNYWPIYYLKTGRTKRLHPLMRRRLEIVVRAFKRKGDG